MIPSFKVFIVAKFQDSSKMIMTKYLWLINSYPTESMIMKSECVFDNKLENINKM